jgi:hypothetical protein
MSRPAEMAQSDSARSMTKSGGEKTGPTRRARGSRAVQDKQEGVSAVGDLASLAREAERLREELAIERKRAEQLEATNATVAVRLTKAIASIKELLERRG